MSTVYRLPFHDALIDELKAREPQSWEWFANQLETEASRKEQLTSILKSNARISEGSAPELEAALAIAKQQLDERRPITLYRAIGASLATAGIYVQTDQLHIIVSGNLESLLDPEELAALMGHELGHARLMDECGGELAIADQMLGACSQQSGSGVWQETDRRLRLLNEIACDRAALHVTGSLLATVGMLLKVVTGSARVSAVDYLQQAEEIFEREGKWDGQQGSQGHSHPEEHIRVLALRWWDQRKRDAESDIQRLIEGRSDLTRLTLIDQKRWQHWTEQLIRHVLASAWRATEASLAHARLYDPILPTSGPIRATTSLELLQADLEFAGPELRDYACFVLLDFATCDPALDDLAIAQAIHLSRGLQLEARLLELLKRELKMRKRQLDSLGKKATDLLQAAQREFESEASNQANAADDEASSEDPTSEGAAP